MKELTRRAETARRKELLAICPGSLIFADVRAEARSGNVVHAYMMFSDVCLQGRDSLFARRGGPVS